MAAYEISSNYFFAINEIFGKFPSTDQTIRVPKLPIYTLSGGATMPSCAFIKFKEPPVAPEAYYTNAMLIAIRRRGLLSLVSDAERIAEFCRLDGNSPAEEWNWRASVLMDAATLLSVSFPYLYDYGISRDGTQLVAADEFARIGRITMALDCEGQFFPQKFPVPDFFIPHRWFTRDSDFLVGHTYGETCGRKMELTFDGDRSAHPHAIHNNDLSESGHPTIPVRFRGRRFSEKSFYSVTNHKRSRNTRQEGTRRPCVL